MFTIKHNPPEVGSAAYIARSTSTQRKGKVVKVTAAGQITVELDSGVQIRFTKNGDEVGNRHFGWYMISEDSYTAREERRVRDQKWFGIRSGIEQLTASASQRDRNALLEQLAELTAKVEAL